MPPLQSLRFLCVLFVLLHHAYPDTTNAVGHMAMVLCEGSVAFFFVLSGYVLSMSYGNRLRKGTTSWTSFMGSRLRKLYPLHFLCLSLFVFSFIRHLPALDPMTLLASLLLIQSWVPIHDVYFGGNAVAWFLSSLLLSYALFPMLYRVLFCGKRTMRIAFITLGVISYGALLLFNTDAEAYVYVAPYARLADFTVGMGMARWASTTRCERMVTWSKVTALLLIATVVVVYPYVPESMRVCSIYWPACLALLYGYGLPSPTGEQPNVVRRTLRRLGNLSFPFYMIHLIALNSVNNVYEHLFPGTTPLPVTLVATILVSLIFAYVYHSYIAKFHKS